MTNISKWLLLTAAVTETIMAIPILGAVFIIGLFWTPMIFALCLHIVALVFIVKENKGKMPSIVGIIANTVGFIPVVGWVLHILAAIFNWIGAFKE